MHDLKHHSPNDFATKKKSKSDFAFTISTTQEIKKNYLYENKLHNIQLASNRIESVVIEPNQIFSFWKCVKTPNQKNKYKVGRNIVNGQVSEEIGGGLCQVSGIIYQTSLKSGLTILERHNHSVDIYKEEERFAPIGSDATVVYGYKDLRIKNNQIFPVKFTFSINENSLACCLASEELIQERKIEFERIFIHDRIEVTTIIDSIPSIISVYKNLK